VSEDADTLTLVIFLLFTTMLTCNGPQRVLTVDPLKVCDLADFADAAEAGAEVQAPAMGTAARAVNTMGRIRRFMIVPFCCLIVINVSIRRGIPLWVPSRP
jgi:hypothetical protein